MSVQHQNILKALREAGEDGVPESGMLVAGGAWWRKRVSEINRRPGFAIGYRVEHGEQVHVLTREPGAQRASADDETGLGGSPSVAGSLSPEPETLFPAVPQPHFREAA